MEHDLSNSNVEMSGLNPEVITLQPDGDLTNSVASDCARDLQRPGVEDPDWPIVWPHEVRESVKFAGSIAFQGILMNFRHPISRSLSRTALMERLNGEGSGFLADKYEFIELLGQLGYNVPRQSIVLGGQRHEDSLAGVRLVAPIGNEPLICKPRHGSGGQGIIEVSADRFDTVVGSMRGDYVIQERVKHEIELRYIRKLDATAEQILRIYGVKTISKIEGDGVRTVRQLIQDSGQPFGSRVGTLARRAGSLGLVIPEGGTIHVSGVGMKANTSPEWSGKHRRRVDNMDRFMRHLIGDMQTAVGHQLPVLCFDIGLRDGSVIDGHYDFESIRESAVPFECQMPFTAMGYVASSRKPIIG